MIPCVGRWLALVAACLVLTALLLALIAGEFAVLIAAGSAAGPGSGLGLLLSFALGLPVTFALAVVAHELGHVLGGLAAGLPVRLAHVGPLTVSRGPAGWRVAWDRRQPWRARAVCAPHVTGRWRLAAFVLAGPGMNLVMVIPSAALAAATMSSALGLWVALFALHSAFFGLANLVPLRDRGHPTDGLALWLALTARPGLILVRNGGWQRVGG